MCGIVGGITNKDITPLLLEGLNRLEYRGYDSSGLIVLSKNNIFNRARSVGKVKNLEDNLTTRKHKIIGNIGIAHTRWATHGEPSNHNAHPHISKNSVSVVHNGIIENYIELKNVQLKQGYEFTSDTDTEVIAHAVDFAMQSSKSLVSSVQKALKSFEGSYGLGIISSKYPDQIIAARNGSPLVIGVGKNGNYIASDQMALLSETKKFIFLEEGDVAEIKLDKITIFDLDGNLVDRPVISSKIKAGQVDKGNYDHFMQKEIYEQPRAIGDTIEAVIDNNKFDSALFGKNAKNVLKDANSVLILAAGTSYYAGLTAKYWLEDVAKIQTSVEISSEYRYRNTVPNKNQLVISISQSGETLDTIEALKHAKKMGHKKTLAICNVQESAIARASKLTFYTRAGIEIGVASTKAFTTQLVSLFILTITLAKNKKLINKKLETKYLNELRSLVGGIQTALNLEPQIKQWAKHFSNKDNALFLGRGIHYPIALEGSLKLKEISYIHAEAYPAGELKHGPLALVDKNMPVVVIAPNDSLLEKVKSNMQEVKARGGILFVFADSDSHFIETKGIKVIRAPRHSGILSPIIHTIPVQLLAYHVALRKGTDVDKPRNLAKSVTVE